MKFSNLATAKIHVINSNSFKVNGYACRERKSAVFLPPFLVAAHFIRKI